MIADQKKFMKNNVSKKLKTIVIFCSIISLSNYVLISLKTEIVIDNRMKIPKENNLDFSKFSTTIKSIAIYNPKNYLPDEKKIDNSHGVIKDNSLYSINLEEKIKIAKNHGIYGLAFNYIWPKKRNIDNNEFDIIFENKKCNIKFLIIWNKVIKQFVNEDLYLMNFVLHIKKYFLDQRYIKIENKHVLGIKDNNTTKNELNIIRRIFKEKEIGEIYILTFKYDGYFNNCLQNKTFDGIIHSIQYNSLENVYGNYFYTHLLYSNLFKNKFDDKNKIFRTCVALSSEFTIINNHTKFSIYNDYSPEKFYLLNKIIIDWTIKNHKVENQYIFINNFENLGPDNFGGYANLNYFSKALYGLPIVKTRFNLRNLQNKVSVLVQAHVFYLDLINDIINKTNNIPVPFDLFITTNTELKKTIITKLLKLNSKANKFEILVVENKGRDVIPLLIQLKDIINNYKYFCHIHTKKHYNNKEIGKFWQVYLYENLLGNINTISQILSDFENNNKLGFIFPEHFHAEIKFAIKWNYFNLKHINHILKIIFPNKYYKVGKYLNFPVGNMFWARTQAVYQIFDNSIINLAPKEKGQIDNTILHAIERIWLYLTKINGFYYKTFLYYI